MPINVLIEVLFNLDMSVDIHRIEAF